MIRAGNIKYIKNNNDNSLQYYYNINVNVNSQSIIKNIETKMRNKKVIIKQINPY